MPGEMVVGKISTWVVCPECGNEDASAFKRQHGRRYQLEGVICSDCNTKVYWQDTTSTHVYKGER